MNYFGILEMRLYVEKIRCKQVCTHNVIFFKKSIGQYYYIDLEYCSKQEIEKYKLWTPDVIMPYFCFLHDLNFAKHSKKIRSAQVISAKKCFIQQFVSKTQQFKIDKRKVQHGNFNDNYIFDFNNHKYL